MTKQGVAHIARIMYDLQEYCAANFWGKYPPCKGCAANKERLVCNLFVDGYGIPKMWGITKADIERLEGEIDK